MGAEGPRGDGGGLALGDAPGNDVVRRFSHEAMATVFEVHAVHPDARYAAQAAQAAFDLLDRLERELSRFLSNSDISRINRLGAGEATRVSPSTLECLSVAGHAYELTGGAFDPSLGTGWPSLDLDPVAFTVSSTRGGVRLDLGAIGKGYAVDRMADILREWGLAQVLVHGGFSSVLALDPPGDAAGWLLTLSDPADQSRVLETLDVRHGALGASGLRKGDHIVEPATGAAPIRRAAWVQVERPDARPQEPGPPAAAIADALATACMLLPDDAIEALCAEHPGLRAWLLDEGSRVCRFGGR